MKTTAATLTIRQGTRKHDLKIGKTSIEFREQRNAVTAVTALVRAGVVNKVNHVTVPKEV